MRYFTLLILIISTTSLSANPPTQYQWIRLLSLFDLNRDQILSNKELGNLWYSYGKYDFNRDQQLTKQEYIEKRIPPAIKK